MAQVGSVEVIATLNTSQYERGAREVESANSRMEGNSNRTGSGVGNMFNKVAKVGLAAVAAAAVAAGAAIASNIGGAIKRVDTLNNFPKVMENLGYGANESTAAIKALDKGVKGLPTSLDAIASAMQNIAPSSKSLDYATQLTLALNNALVAGGKPAELQTTAMEQFSQAIAKGRPDLEEWRSIATAMPGQMKQLSNSLGYDNWQAMAQAVSDGTLSFQDVQDALINLNKTGASGFPSFAEQAKNASGGLETAMTQMNTAIKRGIASVIEAIGSGNITNAITNVGKAFENALNGFASFANFVKDNKDVILPIVVSVGTLVGLITAWVSVVKVAAAVQTAWNIAMAANPIGIIIVAIAALAAGLVTLGERLGWWKAMWAGITAVLSPVVDMFSKYLMPIITQVAAFIGGVFKQSWDRMTVAVNQLMFALQPFMPALKMIGAAILVVSLGPLAVLITTIFAFIAAITAAVTAVVWFAGAVSKAFSDALNTVAGFVSRFGGLLSSLPGRVLGIFNNVASSVRSINWYGIGVDIIRGIGSGIANMGGWLAGQAMAAVGSAKEALKNFLKIKSPSQVMRDEIGKMMGEGVGVGILSSISSVKKAVGTFSSGMMSEFTGSPILTPALAGNVSFDDTDLQGGGGSRYEIGVININSEVDGERWLKRLTGDQEVISNGMTPTQSFGGYYG